MIWGNTHDTVLITFLGRVQNKIRRTLPNLVKSRIEQTATKHCKGIYETFLFSGFQINMYIFICVYYVY